MLICEKDCVNGELDYQFRQGLSSTTQGPSLVAKWGQASYITDRGDYCAAENGQCNCQGWITYGNGDSWSSPKLAAGSAVRCSKEAFGDVTPNGYGYCYCRRGMMRFEAGQGFDLNEGNCIKPETYSVLVEARLDTVAGARQLVGSPTWGSDGVFVDQQYMALPKDAGLLCPAQVGLAFRSLFPVYLIPFLMPILFSC